MKLRYKIAGSVVALIAVSTTVLALVLAYTPECGSASPVAEDAKLMKAIVYRCYGSPDVLEFADIAKPSPADGEVLVRVHAASVNPYDWHFMRGSPYFMRLGSGIGVPTETRLGADFAGTVESVGGNVTRFKPGDQVFGGSTGAFADYVVVREQGGLVLKPTDVTFEQAAGVPIAGLTALQALRDHGKIGPGQKVLINGASGGVGTFAVQIAKAFGAEVTGVCSARNADMVRSIGADHVIDYTKEDYTRGDERYDLIVDMVGNHSLSANRGVLIPDGRLVLVGGPKGNWLGPLIGPLKAFLLSPFVGQDIGMMIAQFRHEDLVLIGELMQAGQVTPVIDRIFPLNELAEAMRYSESGRARGKIIISVDAN